MINVDNPVALGHLTEARKHHPKEVRIQTKVTDMFKALGTTPVLAKPVGGREADIFVSDYRCVIETKATGKADPKQIRSQEKKETQEEQLFFYVEELRKELRNQYDPDKIADKPWVGILTDGQSGWIWKWDEKKGMFRKQIEDLKWTQHDSDKKVLENICKVFVDIEPSKKWIDPKEIYEIFRRDEDEFASLYEKLTKNPDQEIITKYDLWLDRLQGSGMVPAHAVQRHKLFVKHCFLIAVAKAVIAALTPETDDDDPEVVLGEGFTAWLVDNKKGIEKSQALFEKARSYNWRFQFGDVLRNLYEQCIEEDNRKIYGEYYTPDWVAEQMAEEILEDEWIETAVNAALEHIGGASEALNGIGILDPACGSGTFLYHAARRIARASSLRKEHPSRRALVVVRLVHGIDIHPVAVEMAKATLLRALPPISRESIEENFSGQLNITQGDSLLTEGIENYEKLYGEALKLKSPKGTVFELPLKVVRDSEFRNFLPKLVEAACKHDPIPTEVPEGLRNSLKPFLDSLTEVIDKERDSVWTWHILNTLGPFCLFERKVNRILTNPPWVRLSNIQVESRKTRIKTLAENLKLLVGGRKTVTSFDIAALFIHRCRNLYLDEQTGKAAWITSNAAIKAENWKGFRNQHQKFLTKIIDYGQLKDPPFDTASSCALIQGESFVIENKFGSIKDKPPITKIEDKVCRLLNANKKIKVRREQKWEEIRDATYLEPLPEPIPRAESKYIGEFRQGATIVPQCLLVVEEVDKEKNDQLKITTRRSRDRYWDHIEPLTGKVPQGWVHSCIFSNDLLPFTIRPETTQAIVPLDKNELIEGSPENKLYWSEANEVWEKKQEYRRT